MPVFTLTVHPASEGDLLTLTWGETGALHHALIDLGRTRDYRALRPLLEGIGTFELFVVSHVDADHIEGAMPLVKEAEAPFRPERVWFNAYHHLLAATERMAADTEEFGGKQGDKLAAGIQAFAWTGAWNSDFESGIVSVDSPEAGHPITLGGGLTIRLLSPDDARLAALGPRWLAELKAAHLEPFSPDIEDQPDDREIFAAGVPDVAALAATRFEEDTAKANGSSIAFVAEFAGRRVLLGADAHPAVLASGLAGLGATPDRPYRIDCLKLSHHGSKANTSPALLELIDCTSFAVSTDGTRHGHPDPETVARILAHDPARPKRLFFNTDQPHARVWNNAALQSQYRYDCVFPGADERGITLDLLRP